MTPATAIIKFEVNKPQVLALAYAEGKPSQSRYSGDQLMFTTTTGDRFFVEPYVGDRIAAAGITVGKPFEICKRETMAGNRRVVDFQVRAIAPPPLPQPPPMPPAPRTSAPSAPVTATAPVNGAGQTAAEIMAECYRVAVDIAVSTQAYAHENGLNLAPVFEDVRTMGTALFIQTQGRR
jgi:hypothetical protein